ncbi:KGG domain-containing protein [Paludibacterium purpuratum]|uniref:Stress-induced acidophilic repeat protein n=1 Tax=Paludibacterium purpuratum TaxID=1144873 RepID=A0A4R7BDC6_9NEIS|nr:KGG domain-containing protein [Paludibacterium purpuratum]TDR81965.1 hypothetical protein DFP86_10275 [Paludibacterium purpuratum]
MTSKQASHAQEPDSPKGLQGFASMDEERQREIASKGGHAAHEKGTAHKFTPEEAREAGRKGGETVSEDRQHMAEIGRKGGERSHRNDRATEQNKKQDRHETPMVSGKQEGGESETEEEDEEISKTGAQ